MNGSGISPKKSLYVHEEQVIMGNRQKEKKQVERDHMVGKQNEKYKRKDKGEKDVKKM